ncbi:MAG: tetratricopeptide repeat protein [Bdellovibrionaceae bacterium]|nr:tetratricopeptide repeat protein [Pseudobdellovibrionaceae bacterium]MDW8189441.1 tetratricopeptide repeat protein [Pseudobdellovibrionaceae bacterium]
MRILLALATLVLLGSCAHFSEERREKARLQFEIAMGYLESGSYPEALNHFLKAHELDPDDPHILNGLGLTYFHRGRVDLAKKHLLKAIKKKPSYTEAINNLSFILIENQQYAEAEKYIKRALQDLTYPKPATALLNLGYLNYKINKLEAAKRPVTQALQYDRDNCFGNHLLAKIYYAEHDFKNAARAFDKASAVCSLDAADEIHYYAGMSYQKAGDLSRAKARYQEILRLFPESNYRDLAEDQIQRIERVLSQ